jgi:hypothetical protein
MMSTKALNMILLIFDEAVQDLQKAKPVLSFFFKFLTLNDWLNGGKDMTCMTHC